MTQQKLHASFLRLPRNMNEPLGFVDQYIYKYIKDKVQIHALKQNDSGSFYLACIRVPPMASKKVHLFIYNCMQYKLFAYKLGLHNLIILKKIYF